MRTIPKIAWTWMALTAAGCGLPVVQYHTGPPTEEGCRPPADCDRAFIEETDEYLLGFVEFDDLGWAHDRDQQSAIINRVGRVLDGGQDVLMVVFAHGWKHDARTCDSNVTCFRSILTELHQTELAIAPKGKARRIVGVYLGWRGTSWDNDLLKQLTFYGRKGTAHKVGSGAVTELLVRLKQLRQRRHRAVEAASGEVSSTRLVIVGHSFGGALIFSATSQLIMERMAVADSSEDRRVHGFGDLVVLVNPAFEAARFQPLYVAAERGDFVTDQAPVFVVATSRGDGATKKAFPAGRSLSILLDDYPEGEVGRSQKQANKQAVGHFEPFRSHFLETRDTTPEPDQPDRSQIKQCKCPFPLHGPETATTVDVTQSLRALRGHDWQQDPEFEFPTSVLQWEEGKLPANTPVMVVSINPEIITSHSDIYQPAFVDFLRHLIMGAGEEQVYE